LQIYNNFKILYSLLKYTHHIITSTRRFGSNVNHLQTNGQYPTTLVLAAF